MVDSYARLLVHHRAPLLLLGLTEAGEPYLASLGETRGTAYLPCIGDKVELLAAHHGYLLTCQQGCHAARG